MDTEFNYLYEDKYYENAVKNLKSTFYDVVEREEIMLNNLENRIAQEADDGVKARLLDLWSKQNDSLDQSIVMFRQLKQSVRVIDSFVKELSLIDEQIVSDIINNTNYIKSSRIEQMRQQDAIEQQSDIQDSHEKEQINLDNVSTPIVEENIPEMVSENSEIEENVQEDTTEIVSEPKEIQDSTVEEPVEEKDLIESVPEIVSDSSKVEENTQEDTTEIVSEPKEEQDSTVEAPVEEKVLTEAVPEIVYDSSKVEENTQEETTEIAPEPKEEQDSVLEEPIEEKVLTEDIPDIVSDSSKVEENTQEEKTEIAPDTISEDLSSTVEDNAFLVTEESSIEEKQPLIPLEEEHKVVEENNSYDEYSPLIPIDETNNLEEDKNVLLENVEIPEDNIDISEIQFDEDYNTDNDVPEMEIVNEENDGMDLPNIVEADNIDPQAMAEEENTIDINVTEENNDIIEVPSSDNSLDNPENSKEKADFVPLEYVLKEDEDVAKAIIVNESQYDKLVNSLYSQEEKLFRRGYLTTELVNNTNYVLPNSIKEEKNSTESEIEKMIAEEEDEKLPTHEEMENMIEQAAELYKSGKKKEAQALYEKISSLSDRIHEKKGLELVKTA